MNLSIVLWNCNGPPSSTVGDRVTSMRNTYEQWEREETIPSVVLAQEVEGIGRRFWIERARFDSENKTKTACFPFPPGILDKFIYTNIDNEDVLKDRIKCCVLNVGGERLLICSYHGPHIKHTHDMKIDVLKRMLSIVEGIKRKNKCCAALVGGDYNLVSNTCTNLLAYDTDTPEGAKVYDNYERPSWRPNLIDFIIAWPKERFLLQKCSPIREITDGSLFDHAPIRYNFIFPLPVQIAEQLSLSLEISLKLADGGLVNREIEGFPAWIIPKENLESTIINNERSDKADKIISILLCYEYFKHRLSFPENNKDLRLVLKWEAVMTTCLLRGINIYHSEDCSENLTTQKAIEIANKYNKNENIKIIGPKITKKEKPLTLPECLTYIAENDTTAVTLTATDRNNDSKTISFVRNDNNSIILIDSHFNNDYGALIQKISKGNFKDTSNFLTLDVQNADVTLVTFN